MGRNILSMAFKQSEIDDAEVQIVTTDDVQSAFAHDAQGELAGGAQGNLVGAFKVEEAPKAPNGEEAHGAEEAPQAAEAPKAEMSFLWIVATGIAMVLLI